jgi:hypothetical protein
MLSRRGQVGKAVIGVVIEAKGMPRFTWRGIGTITIQCPETEAMGVEETEGLEVCVWYWFRRVCPW